MRCGEPVRRCHSLPIKAQNDIDQLSAWAPTVPSYRPASPVFSIYSKAECVRECYTWGLRSFLGPLLAPVLRFLTVPNQFGMHRGNPETGTSCPSVLFLFTGVGSL